MALIWQQSVNGVLRGKSSVGDNIQLYGIAPSVLSNPPANVASVVNSFLDIASQNVVADTNLRYSLTTEVNSNE